MTQPHKRWYLWTPAHWTLFRAVPMSRLWVLMMAAFLLFSAGGFYADLIAKGTRPYAVVLMSAAYSGLNACLWILVLSRFSRWFFFPLTLLQVVNNRLITAIALWMTAHFGLKAVPSESGIYVAATAMLWVSILAYVFFLRYIVREGKQSLRVQNELELAHGMQKTLVPALAISTSRFEIHGTSQPSERVGGDLVDALLLPNGDAVAYLADIAGHGLPASILMGRLKTAARTALLEACTLQPSETLPLVLERLNLVLPQVKEPNMYATFTGFRFGADGSVFYALAASPPILHWHASSGALSHRGEPQLPLGLLPTSGYEGYSLQAEPGDLLVVATDGILEVANKKEEEFGLERLQAVIARSPRDSLPELAGKILAAARAFGPQADDQTILLVRCR